MEESDTLDLSSKRFNGNQLMRELQARLTPYIARLDLTGNQITEECASYLAEKLREPGCSIISLCVTETRLTVAAASTLFKAVGESPLIEFYADDLVLKPESLALLANSINFSSPLEILSLVGCDISSEGFEALIRCLSEAKNLKHLRIDSNSIYETGVRLLGDCLENSSLTTIEIADNMIWIGGMTSFLEKVMVYPYLTGLDISYNAVDLSYLAKVLVANQNITHLAISGCKVNESSVLPFLESISKTRLHTLIFDGFNYQVLPTSWPQVQDTIFSKRLHFEAFTQAIINSETLVDIRIGYLELEQINSLEQNLTNDKISKNIKLSLNDFGRNKDCWVLNFPAFSVDAPSDVMEWGGKIDESNAEYMGLLMRHALFNDNLLSKMDLSAMLLTNGVLEKILLSLEGMSLQKLDIADNKLTDEAVTALTNHLQTASITEIMMTKNKFTDIAADVLFHFLANNSYRSPNILEFQFNINESNELREHQCIEDLAQFLQSNPSLKTFKLIGNVSPLDVIKIVRSLSSNSTLTELVIDSSYMEAYKNPDPFSNPEKQEVFDRLTEIYVNLAKELHSVLTTTSCVLQNFTFELLTEVYIYRGDIIPIWNECEKKLKENRQYSN